MSADIRTKEAGAKATEHQMKYTTYSGLQVILRALQQYGVTPEHLADKHDIQVPQNSDIGQHISPNLIEQILDVAIEETGDAALPLAIAEHISPSTFGEFSIGLLTSHSLFHFLDRVTKYYPYISTAQRLRSVHLNDRVFLLSHFAEKSIKPEVQQLWVEVAFAFIFRFMRLMGRPDFNAATLDLLRPVPSETKEKYEAFFGVAPTFASERNAISFSYAELEVPLANGGLEIAEEYEKRMIQKIAAIDSTNLPLRVHAYISSELPRRPLSKEVVASYFAMSVKTLQNKLAKSGTSYQKILDQTRRELSEMYLSFPEVTLAQIADLLGYSDASNFCRAYKRWTGELPRSKAQIEAIEHQ
ncbi:AraC family transcriptional regulator ligand-binding domain-containing protein [Hyphomonas sp. FCG-A18]|uniref:AraC family transcriptional regulator n=1 Tax=Hyphomonas sp. FCG-A18 TaxID=3080019 RepID=UPI002B29F85C|nr:AraC family transcriptional regulator ligand-binding domain-containing protein [Hyphomonas sp. FCG-A18]